MLTALRKEPERRYSSVAQLSEDVRRYVESFTAQRRFAEAETILLEAYKAQKARALPEQYDLVETRRRPAELYRAWGKADDARRYE